MQYVASGNKDFPTHSTTAIHYSVNVPMTWRFYEFLHICIHANKNTLWARYDRPYAWNDLEERTVPLDRFDLIPKYSHPLGWKYHGFCYFSAPRFESCFQPPIFRLPKPSLLSARLHKRIMNAIPCSAPSFIFFACLKEEIKQSYHTPFLHEKKIRFFFGHRSLIKN